MKVTWEKSDIYPGRKIKNRFYQKHLIIKHSKTKELGIVDIDSGFYLILGSEVAVADYLTLNNFQDQ